MAGPHRGIGSMGDIRRPPPLRHFLQLYRSNHAFQAMVDFVVLGGLTIAFLEPQLLLHPWSHKAGVTASSPQQQQAAPIAAPIAPPPPAAAPAARPSPAPQAKQEAPVATPPAVSAAPSTDGSKAIANLKKLPAWPQIPVMPVTTAGLHDVAIPFSTLALSASHPSSRLLALDERAFANLPFQIRDKLKAALDARANQDPDRVRDALKDMESPEGTPELLIGLSYLINAAAETNGTAETTYRAALAKGQPQAPVLLGLLLTSGAKGLSGSAIEGKALIDAVSANDRAAWLALGNSYLNGESGALDPVKGAPWIRKAAEAGEPLALLQFARLAEAGIGMEKDAALAEGALRRAAELGLTEAEDTLGRWILLAYEKKTITDPTEGVKLQERVIAKNLVFGMNSLGRLYNGYGQAPLWKDDARGVKLYQGCAQYKIRQCHNNLGLALQYGRGVDRDPVAAWARYDVGRQLAGDYVMPGLTLLDKTLTLSEKDEAKKQSKEILSQLKPQPNVIVLRRDR